MTNFHMHISIKGALAMSEKQFKKSYKGVFSYDNGLPMSVHEARCELLKELALGHEVLTSQGCDNFDWKTGCKGHDANRKETE